MTEREEMSARCSYPLIPPRLLHALTAACSTLTNHAVRRDALPRRRIVVLFVAGIEGLIPTPT